MTDEPDRRERGSTAMDQVWRLLGWACFFGIGYYDVIEGHDIDWYYHAACAFVAEREFAMIIIREHIGKMLLGARGK